MQPPHLAVAVYERGTRQLKPFRRHAHLAVNRHQVVGGGACGRWTPPQIVGVGTHAESVHRRFTATRSWAGAPAAVVAAKQGMGHLCSVAIHLPAEGQLTCTDLTSPSHKWRRVQCIVAAVVPCTPRPTHLRTTGLPQSRADTPSPHWPRPAVEQRRAAGSWVDCSRAGVQRWRQE